MVMNDSCRAEVVGGDGEQRASWAGGLGEEAEDAGVLERLAKPYGSILMAEGGWGEGSGGWAVMPHP